MGLIPYRNGFALAAYYVGLFSCIPFLFPFGLLAIYLGLRGLKLAREEPEVEGTVHAWVGIVSGGLFCLLWLVVAVVLIVSWQGKR